MTVAFVRNLGFFSDITEPCSSGGAHKHGPILTHSVPSIGRDLSRARRDFKRSDQIGTVKWNHSVPHAAPHFCRIDRLVGIEGLRPFQQDVGSLRVRWIRDATIVDRTDCRTLRFIKMADTFGASIMSDHVNIVAHALTVTHMKALLFCAAARFEDGLVRTFR